MSKSTSAPQKPLIKVALAAVVLAGAVLFAASTRDRWLPLLQRNMDLTTQPTTHEVDHDQEHEGESAHDHEHEGHVEANSIELSANGLRNIGFKSFEVEASDFEKKLTLPAIVAERPGRSQVHITASITGIVTKIFAVEGQAVEAESPLFTLRITNEDVVTAQTDLLRTSESIKVVDQELARLNALAEGVVAGKRILEQQYEKQKLEGSLLAERQGLIVHGLTEDQVANILETRQLIRTITISAPNHKHDDDSCVGDHLFHVQSLPVALGQQVATGQELAVLGDHCELYVEGRAFEDDASQLREALKEGRNIEGVLLGSGTNGEVITGLKLMYLADRIDPQSRAFHFYLRLPNEITLDQQPFPDRRFIEWRFKPGQRMELRVPVERWEKQLVLPVDAIVDEGAEAYAYRQNGDHFDRVPVQIEYRDRDAVVIANNGSLFPGDIVAGKGAYQIHLALKNKSGGGIDPHAGHNH